MSVPPQLVAAQMGAGPGGPAGPTPQGPREVPPGAAPLAQPQAKRGQQTVAMARVEIAFALLKSALPELGRGSPEHAAVAKVLNSLARITAKRDTSDLVPAQVLQMVRGMPQMGGGTPVQQELMRQMAMARGGGPGGAPGGPPGGLPGGPPGASPGAPQLGG